MKRLIKSVIGIIFLLLLCFAIALGESIDENNVFKNFTCETMTIKGVTFEWMEDGSCRIYGTATEAARYIMYKTESGMPDFLEDGQVYQLHFNGKKVGIVLQQYDGDKWEDICVTTKPCVVTMPVAPKGIRIRLDVNSGSTIDETIKPVLVLQSKADDMKMDSNSASESIDEEEKSKNTVEANIVPVRNSVLVSNGITYSPNGDGSYRITGTREGVSVYNLYTGTGLPDGFKPGESYRFVYDGTGKNGSVYLRVRFRTNGEEWYSFTPFLATTAITIPDDATELGIRLEPAVNSENIDITVQPRVFPLGSLADLSHEIIGEYPPAMLSIIDDDGNEKYYTDLFPLLETKHAPIASAVIVSMVGARNQMDWVAVQDAFANGAEILSHTFYHNNSDITSQQTVAELTAEYQKAKNTLAIHGIDTGDILVYNGATGNLLNAREAAERVYTCGIYATGNITNQYMATNPYYIYRYNVEGDYGYDVEKLKNILLDLYEQGTGWMIWTIHTSSKNWNSATLQAIIDSIDYCSEIGLPIVTVHYGRDHYISK